MGILEIVLLMSVIIVIGFLIKGATGFGAALISMPLFLLFLDIKFMLPVFLIVQLSSDFYLIPRLKKDIHKKIILILLISSIIGVIVGTYLLKILDSELIKTCLGIYIILFSIKILFFNNLEGAKQKINKQLGVIAGFFGGFIDALFATGGPPIVMYLNHVNVNKAVFRATCVAAFFIFHVGRIVTYSYTGMFNLEILKMGVYLIPATIIGLMIGMKIHIKLNEILFKKIVATMLIIVGVVLLI